MTDRIFAAIISALLGAIAVCSYYMIAASTNGWELAASIVIGALSLAGSLGWFSLVITGIE